MKFCAISRYTTLYNSNNKKRSCR